MQDWMPWAERVGDRLVDMGSPLENDGDADVQESGYSAIDADSKEQLDGILRSGGRGAVRWSRARMPGSPGLPRPSPS